MIFGGNSFLSMTASGGAVVTPTFIASVNGGASDTTVTLPTHQAGDLILICAFKNTETAPSLASGYSSTAQDASTAVVSGSGVSIRLGWKIAASSSETSGTWASANRLFAFIYRNVDGTNPISAAANASGVSTTVNWPALSFTGSRLIFGAHKFDGTQTGGLDSRLTSRRQVSPGSTEQEAGDSVSALSSWASGTATASASFGYNTIALAIKGA